MTSTRTVQAPGLDVTVTLELDVFEASLDARTWVEDLVSLLGQAPDQAPLTGPRGVVAPSAPEAPEPEPRTRALAATLVAAHLAGDDPASVWVPPPDRPERPECDLCGRRFPTQQSLHGHQATCGKKPGRDGHPSAGRTLAVAPHPVPATPDERDAIVRDYQAATRTAERRPFDPVAARDAAAEWAYEEGR